MTSEVTEVIYEHIPEGWGVEKLIDCTTDGNISYGIVQPGQHEKDGIPIIRVNNVNNGQLVLDDVLRVSSTIEEKYKRTRLEGGEVLLTLVGSTGQSFVAPPKLSGWNVPRAIAVIRPKEEIGANWINICLQSKPVQHFLDIRANTTVQKTLNLKDVRDIPIPIPPKHIKQSIEEVAVSLANKIELNRQINQTLEHIAQAIFKSWFVDFEPVKAKIHAKQNGQDSATARDGGSAGNAGAIASERAAMCTISGKTDTELDTWLQTCTPEQRQQLTAAALFPDELEDSELGPIPKGWEATTFGEVSSCFDSKRVPLSKRQREQRQGAIPYYGATSIMDYVDEYLFDGIYLLLGEDGSVLKDDGTPFVQYIWGKSWVNNHAHVLQGKNGVSTEQLLVFIQNTNIAAYVTGAVQLKLNQKNMKSIPLVKASEDINQQFQAIIKPLFAKYRQCSEEIAHLISLRDALLPKLLSGDVTLAETQLETEAVA